jgi:hypothetical protein
MPLFEEKTHQTEQSTTTKTTPDNKSNLLTIIGQCLPFAPLVFEQFTGQKVPQLSGTIAEITNSLQQIHLSLQTLANNQQQLANRISQLETNASQQLTSLTNQFKSLRLTHTKEQKQIEYKNPSRTEEETQDY